MPADFARQGENMRQKTRVHVRGSHVRKAVVTVSANGGSVTLFLMCVHSRHNHLENPLRAERSPADVKRSQHAEIVRSRRRKPGVLSVFGSGLRAPPRGSL